jgi:brefeldin A-inhibited guanine nucleotide-exchange protein
LGTAWVPVLQCVSRFDLVYQLQAGLLTDATIFSPNSGAGGGAAGDGGAAGAGGKATAAAGKAGSGEEAHSSPVIRVADLMDPMEVNDMFVRSERLNSEAVVQFVRALCSVSLEEIAGERPRVFALTKIVEIAHFNMNRIRLVWTRIWNVLADYFVTVGCHPNLQVRRLLTRSRLAQPYSDPKPDPGRAFSCSM